MGQLARVGIAFGRRTPLSSLTGLPASARLDSFTERLLGRFGCASLARRIVDNESLTLAEIELLVSSVPVPVLLKLVELVQPDDAVPRLPRPAVALSFHNLAAHDGGVEELLYSSRRLLRDLPHGTLEVAVYGINTKALADSKLREVLQGIATCRDGVRLVAPAPERFIDNHAEVDQESRLRVLHAQLEVLRNIGFSRLRGTPSADLAAAVHDAGFPGVICTDLASLQGSRDLALEILRIRRALDAGRSLDVWCPVYSASVPVGERGFLDLRLLRALAVGTVVLRKIPVRRASSGSFSPQALALAHQFGANDLGFGAVDSHTRKELRLLPLKDLTAVVRR